MSGITIFALISIAFCFIFTIINKAKHPERYEGQGNAFNIIFGDYIPQKKEKNNTSSDISINIYNTKLGIAKKEDINNNLNEYDDNQEIDNQYYNDDYYNSYSETDIELNNSNNDLLAMINSSNKGKDII